MLLRCQGILHSEVNPFFKLFIYLPTTTSFLLTLFHESTVLGSIDIFLIIDRLVTLINIQNQN